MEVEIQRLCMLIEPNHIVGIARMKKGSQERGCEWRELRAIGSRDGVVEGEEFSVDGKDAPWSSPSNNQFDQFPET